MAKKRTIYGTKSGSFFGTKKGKTKRGTPAKRISNRTHRQLGTLQSKNRASAHRRKKGWL